MPSKKKSGGKGGGAGGASGGKPGSAQAQAAAAEARPARKPRGHRQKGAGTTITSRGDVTVGAITMKEWQRTPKQLLHEWTQRDKRPRPKFSKLRARPGDDPGQIRCRVIVQDQKRPGTDKDLLFMPNQSFPDEATAQHAVALLALYQLAPLQPLERKLPEPYAAMWLAMVKQGKSGGGGGGSGKGGKSSGLKAGGGGGGAAAAAAAAAPAAAAAAVPKGAAAAASVASGPGDDSGFAASWDGDKDSSAGAGPARPAAPVPLLTMANKHLSARDRERARVEREQGRRERQNTREARRALDPNKPPQVLMSEAMRSRVQAVLRAVSETAAFGDGEAKSEADGGGVELDEDTAAEAAAAVEALGFSAERVGEALADVVASPPPALDAGSAEAIAACLVDWLCIRLPEEELPKAFDPRGRNLEVVRPGDGAGAAGASPQGWLALAGFHSADAMAALHRTAGTKWVAAALLQAEALRAVESGSATPAAGGDVDEPGWPPCLPLDEADEDAPEMLEEELAGLELVYGSDFGCHAASRAEFDRAGDASYSLRIVSLPLPDKCVLLAAVRCAAEGASAAEPAGAGGALYPNTAPVFVVVPQGSPSASGLAPESHRLLAATAAAETAASCLGGPCLQIARDAALEAMEALHTVDGTARGGKGGKAGRKPRASPGALQPHLEAAKDRRARLCRPLLPLLKQAVDEATVRAIQAATAAASGAGAGAGADTGGSSGRRSGRRGRGASGARAAGKDGSFDVSAVRPVPRRLQAEFARLDTARKAEAAARAKGDRALASMRSSRAKLPIASFRDEVVRTVRENQVVVLRGETGCGKSTQVPQFLLEDAIEAGAGGRTHIVVTQPRRLAALGLARRVAAERCEPVASSGRGGSSSSTSCPPCVGYHIRGEKRADSHTSVVFCTTGILLRQLQGGLDGAVTHIVVDEVHERSVDADFLLAVLREVVARRPELKVVLMSATVDAGKFQDYFAPRSGGRPCPVIEVPGFVHPVREAYLHDVAAIAGWDPDTLPAREGAAAAEDAAAFMSRGGNLDAAADLLAALAAGGGLEPPPPDPRRRPGPLPRGGGAVLVFLPGVPEIRRLGRQLKGVSGLHIVELHGSLTGEAQGRVFDPPPGGLTKVVLSTNVAETSVTIDDVTTVIDCGRVKEMQYDAMNRASRLAETWAARDSATQRRGRAGRTRPGVCYRMYPRAMWGQLPPHSVPEIKRVALESLCLQVRVLGLGSVRGFLGRCMDPPSPAHVDSALRQLVAMGALAAAPGSKAASLAEEPEFKVTPLGSHLSRLPVDVRLGKCLIFGAVLQCVDPILTVAAGMSNRSPFLSPPDKRAQADAAHKRFNDGHSDHLRLVQAFKGFREAGGYSARRAFCDEHFLSFDGMRTLADLREDYAATLADLGFIQGPRGGAAGRYGELAPEANARSGDAAVVRSALVAGLYPNVIKVVLPPVQYEATAAGSVPKVPSAHQLRLYTRADDADPEVSLAVAAAEAERSARRKGGSSVGGGSASGRSTARSTGSKRSAAHSAASGRSGAGHPSVVVYNGVPQQRVFVHPQSVCFHVGNYSTHCLVFNEKVETRKVYIRDITAAPAYAMLLFGGELGVLPAKGLITVGGDEWVAFTAVARIGSLVTGLRRALDKLLEAKTADPDLPFRLSPVVEVIVELLRGGGM
ncbi:hypothetical protein FNF27_01931 [Cafeteria roenbergensis]|uniref:ATP-dependent RNA helicase n=2 Tax=Cafeteria roenbergensis TaxID=33653 RepID=A0A5A8EL24_CAFRO|nr:hypothetical protein FNF27_01931 [Cafeteria roenbergensis]